MSVARLDAIRSAFTGDGAVLWTLPRIAHAVERPGWDAEHGDPILGVWQLPWVRRGWTHG